MMFRGERMQVDFLTVACLCDSLDLLLGARVQQVLLPDDRSVCLELYAGQRFHLLASADPQDARLLLVPEKPRRGVDSSTPMLLLLRKWVDGARLVELGQPDWERIVTLGFRGRTGNCDLVVELMGRHSNIILVGPDGIILAAVKHVDAQMSRFRTVLPGQIYQPPPAPRAVPPTGVSVAEWRHRLPLAPEDQKLQTWLPGRFLGIGRQVARELAVRASGDADVLARATVPDRLHEAVQELFSPLNDGWWQPHVAWDETGSLVAYAPYEPRQFPRCEKTRNISEAIWRYYDQRGLTDAYAAARESVQARITNTRARLDQRLRRLQMEIVDQSEIEDLRIAGELLLTYQHKVVPGASEVQVLDYSGEERSIDLDPTRTPVENAQVYFKRYEKRRKANERIPQLLGKVQAELAYLEQLEADLAFAESRPEIDAVLNLMAVAGWVSKNRQTVERAAEPDRINIDGYTILIGRNARQNERVTFSDASPGDFWLHARGLPGAHVIIKRGRKDIPEGVVEKAAALAAYYSRARGSAGKVPVDVTEKRFVRRARGRYPGLVTYRNERTLMVRPEPST
jgi:predicted ribosome quality control (RQC) complex YloA/Tae2 family protein